ncbi:MAG: TrkH family potassium uptake protein [Candidatus Diapherotrites archaeon]|nr:TrkH family potassium uptake protein [Candidatus Diapherotrites archaeon]
MAELNKEDLLVILKMIANMVRYLGLFVIPTIIVAFIYGESSYFLLFLAMAALMIVPFSAIYSNMQHIGNDVSLKHGILAIAIGWFVVGGIFAIPYIAEGFSPIDSFFEATSGLSTTGLTMMPHPSTLPFSVNFWRAFTQWFGGFGIVVLALMFFEKPKAAQGLFMAEGRAEGFYNSVYKIARIIMGIYLLYTALGIILYLWSGMDLFNAVVHCFTALSTGGFSTDDIGVGSFGRPAMLVTMIVTCIGGINFVSHWALLRGKIREFFSNSEVKLFFSILLFSTALVFAYAYFNQSYHYFDSIFYIVSAFTTTGASAVFTADQLPPFTILILIVLMIFGCCYGSTGGAIKLWRILILFKAVRREIHKALLPAKTIAPLRVDGKVVPDETVTAVLAFVGLYVFLFAAGVMIFMFVPAPKEPFHYSLQESAFTIASAQGNVGLNVIADPVRWYGMNDFLKILLSLYMTAGRMEILPFFILLKSFGIIRKI